MAEQRKGAAGPGEDRGLTALLSGLTDVDLRTLRAMDDPGLMAVVGDVLYRAREFGEVWYAGEDPRPPADLAPLPDEGTFPAVLGALAPGEDTRG
ncbi:hypothetical protein [Streptomyces camelliae]|uniref:FXSXX-COOH protein n=1 Tax=Streptomyces camelliae TaxID=3004093 RepID=A0ABY7P2H7_9ACTN|nr:hypothetical protein [Streptomyces sp. HUAS 2-6]WBO63902.1 hypothetical protein O1G22_14215 [Streptomyces sp. HUAS 2-6]